LAKLKPENALLDVPVLAVVFAGAGVPKLNDGTDDGVELAGGTAGALPPNEKPVDEAGAPKDIAGPADGADGPELPKLNCGAAAAGAAVGVPACFTRDQQLVYRENSRLLTAPLRFGIPRILQTLISLQLIGNPTSDLLPCRNHFFGCIPRYIVLLQACG
jgi:hypothetical protein